MPELFRIGTEESPLDGVGTLVTPDNFAWAFRQRTARWIVLQTKWLPSVLTSVTVQRSRHRVLVLGPYVDWIGELLAAAFRTVLRPECACLPRRHLAEVLCDKHPESFFIGGRVTPVSVLLYRGNFERLVVPRSWFVPSGVASPDFDDFEIVDYGQTIRLGQYEAATEAVLYDHDANARRLMKKRALNEDPTLGAALKRLRLQRRLRREDFRGVSAKTIARIERGEVKPRADTLDSIALQLDVEPHEIITY